MNSASPHFLGQLRQRGLSFLLLGLLVVAIQLWTALGLMPKASAQGFSVGEICTAQGLMAVQLPVSQTTDNAPSDNSHSNHRCCTYCATSAPLLLLTALSAVSQRLTFVALSDSHSGIQLPLGRYRSPPSHAPPRF